MSFTYNGYTLNEYLEEPWYDTEINLFKGILSKLPNYNSAYVGNQHYHSRVADPNGVYPNSLFVDASGVTNVTNLLDGGLNSGTHAVIATNGLLASATTFANFGAMFTDFSSVISSYSTGADYSGHNTQLALGGATSALNFASTLTYSTAVSANRLTISNAGSASPTLVLQGTAGSQYTSVYYNQTNSQSYLDAGQGLYLRALGGDINIDSTITLASTISLLAGTTTGKILLQAGVASGATISLKTQTNTYMTMANDGFIFSVQESGNTPHATALQLVADSGGNACIGFYAAEPIGRQSAITPPSGGSIVDGEARNAIDTIITVLQYIGVTF
jgi:hypothetical protein